jgi:hypothetical protein
VFFNILNNTKRIHDLNEAEEGQLGWKIMRWVVLFNLVNNPMIFFYHVFLSDCDLITLKKAAKESKWQKAMDEKIMSIEKNNSLELIKLPEGQKSIGVKWIYKTKLRKMAK